MPIRGPRIVLAFAALSIGCVSLQPVRDYATESSALMAYTSLTDRYRDTYAREEPFLDPADESLEKVICDPGPVLQAVKRVQDGVQSLS